MAELIILGSEELVECQRVRLEELLREHGFKAPIQKGSKEVWFTLKDKVEFCCVHYELEDVSMFSPSPEVERARLNNTWQFLCKALKLPGVYGGTCPEHHKRELSRIEEEAREHRMKRAYTSTQI